MRKNLFTCFALLIVAISFSQSQSIVKNINGDATSINEEIKLKNVSIEVTVDSAEEIKSTFTAKGMEELLEKTGEGEEIYFKITCNGKNREDGVKSHVSYEVKGNTDDKKQFMKMIKKIRKAAIKYYHTK